MLAWLLSVTVTRSVPSKRCARVALPRNIQSTAASAMKISLRIAFSPSDDRAATRNLAPSASVGSRGVRYCARIGLPSEGHLNGQQRQFVPQFCLQLVSTSICSHRRVMLGELLVGSPA